MHFYHLHDSKEECHIKSTHIFNNYIVIFHMTEASDKIMNDIQSLQTMEQQLFSSLDANPTLSDSKKKELTININKISNMREGLYDTLGKMNTGFEKTFKESSGSLNQQISAVAIIEKQLEVSRRKLKMMETEQANQIRLVEINDFYGDKYEEHARLMKTIIFTLIPIIILIMLFNKQLLPVKVFYGLIALIALIGSCYAWPIFFSLINRDNMDYQTYDWYFDANAAPDAPSSSASSDPWLSYKPFGTCIGEACCPVDTTFDLTTNQCTITESMVDSMAPSSTNHSAYIPSASPVLKF
tara:strand:+ start:4049 stop:4942 length:894 start_codon:yes stop_codon:yes gene_type:complete